MKTSVPKINVFNRQRKVTVDTRPLKDFLRELAQRLQVRYAFSLVLLSEAAMQKFNLRFAGKPFPTDVLSFSADTKEEPYLGDILISPEAAYRRCQDSPLREMKHLALHGLLHLMGYDHETDNGEMNRLERALREEFGLNFGG